MVILFFITFHYTCIYFQVPFKKHKQTQQFVASFSSSDKLPYFFYLKETQTEKNCQKTLTNCFIDSTTCQIYQPFLLSNLNNFRSKLVTWKIYIMLRIYLLLKVFLEYYQEKYKLWNLITTYHKVLGTRTKLVKCPTHTKVWTIKRRWDQVPWHATPTTQYTDLTN